VSAESPQDKRELLLRLLRERAAKGASSEAKAAVPAPGKLAPLPRIPRTDAMELSFGQERTWVLEQVRPDSHNNILVRFGLQGRLQPEALRRSLEAILERHEVLRATFPVVDGRPVQRISPPERLTIPTLDLSGLSEASRGEENRRAIAAEGRSQFDLAVGPLVRSLLIRFGEEEHYLIVCMHHIVSDGWSVDLLCQELAAFYAAFAAGEPPKLPDLPVQYVDFAHWQRRALAGTVLQSQREYWKKKLAGPLPALELPFDRPPSGSRSFDGVMHKFTMEVSLHSALRELSRREGVTLYTTLLAALNSLLCRYSSQDDVAVGTFVAGRTRIEVERLMGFFINTLVLRSDYSGNPTFREALRRTREVVLEAQANSDFPFDALVAELRPDRDPNRSPFFDVIFNLQSFAFDSGIASADVRISTLSSVEYFAVADSLTVFGYDIKGRQLDIVIVYNPDLFDPATIVRFEKHFTTLLAGIVADPDRRLAELPLLGLDERARLIELGRGPRSSFPLDHGYAHYFEEQARRTPDTLAVVDDDSRLTYRELDSRANRIAHALLEQGIEPGEPVAMCCRRSSTLLSWIIGAFKAGAAYMPLDARYPSGRHAAMLRQSRARLVLVADDQRESIAAAVRDLAPDSSPRILAASELTGGMDLACDPTRRGASSALAYIIFTSGSTGTPKGAMVAHRAMLNHFWTKIRVLELGPADVVAQTAPIGFDISLWQFLAVLLAGGCVRVASETVVQEPEQLFETVDREGVTILQAVPSFLRAFLDGYQGRELEAPDFTRLRSLLLVGEALAPDLVRRWLKAWPRVPLVNGYGPSECADEATRQVFQHPAEDLEVTVPIGRPIDNVRVHILDRNADLLPQGVPGELCIAGAGVGLGYLNDPERTSAAFVRDPFGEPGARLYRTGDRARIRADGVIEFLGRLDFQVKIRGHRIELGEIESVLQRHAAVRQAVVHPWETSAGPRLAAYIVPADPTTPPSSERLRAHLAESLPSYMTPEDFVVLAELPLNPNGKVNRRALPTPATAGTTREFVAPRTEIEAVVAKVWSAVLNEPRVGVHDNFFDIGGHSLLAAQAAARLRKDLQIDLSVRAFFEKQTLADLAHYLQLEKERVPREEFVL
jgi:amino acid adenylation domain-containing protein